MEQEQNNNKPKIRKLRQLVSFCLSGGDIPAGKHLTLWFKPRGDERVKWVKRLGQEVAFEELIVLKDTSVVCVVCQLQDKKLYRGDSIEHVTMETFSGAAPALSNDLINLNKSMCDALKGTVFTKKAFLSAMYYTKDENQKSVKAYSTKSSDWKI